MLIRYLLNGLEKEANKSNEDLTIIEQNANNQLKISVLALKPLKLLTAKMDSSYQVKKDDLMFLNGYQSWTDTHLADLKYKEIDIRRIPKFIMNKYGLDQYGDNHIYDYNKNYVHGFDIFYTQNYFVYNRNYDNAYLIISVDRRDGKISFISDVNNKELQKNAEFMIFDMAIYNSYQEGEKAFYAEFNNKSKKIFGYTSWYNYYQNINEEIILRDLSFLDKRFDLFQIDDGYETFVGDWMDIDPNKFPNGLKPIVDKIHSKGLKAGVWLAPFVCETKSKIFNEHPDWIRKENGKILICGGNWSGFYALDLEKPEVIKYIEDCFNYFKDLGFDFFKLDFLYASNLPTYKGLTRAMQTSKYYQFLRDCLDQKMILGCGANMFNAYNLFDYMRIGPDVSLRFDDIWLMRHLHRERISTKVTLKNTVFRSIFNGHLFGNDPDVFLLRDENMWMSKENRHALITLNALFGSVFFTSDNLGNYDQDKKDELNYALDLLYNAKDVKYYLNKHFINVSYHLNNQEVKFSYDTKKGVILNGKK